MYKQRKFFGQIISVRSVLFPLFLLFCVTVIVPYIHFLNISKQTLETCIQSVIPACKISENVQISYSPLRLLSDTVLSIKASDYMSKKYAAIFSGVKRTTEVPESNAEKTASMQAKEANLAAKGISFINTPGFPVDATELLNSPLSFKSSNQEPRVLIVHTHTSEAYSDCPSSRSDDPEKNVVSVGREIAHALKSAGVSFIHDTTQNDSPSYNQSYKKTLALIEKNIDQYPTIEIVLDIHRDYIEREDGTLAKPTVTVNGQKAAQIMFVIGTDAMGLEHQNWRHNLSFAVKIQNQLNQTAPGLCRSINIRTERFNQHVTPGSMIIEIGAAANTLEEANYAGKLVGDAIGKLLQNY